MDDKTLKSDSRTLVCPTCSARYAMPPWREGQRFGCQKCGASLFFGKFALMQELGRGGFGVVYKAWQADLERVVALKFLHSDSDESAERFIREAKLAAALNHPNITAIYEVGKHEGKLYITMQYVDGSTGHKVQMTPREAAQTVHDAAMAVDYAHAHDVIHRDIKPHNLMVTQEKSGTNPSETTRRVFVMDFGLARSASQGSSLTAEGQVMGTPAFMSPEQAEGETCDVRSDVYSLGATLYALCVRRAPFEAATPVQILMKVARGEVIPPSKLNPEIPSDLESIILKAMSLKREDRYPTASRLASDLARWLGGQVPDSGKTIQAGFTSKGMSAVPKSPSKKAGVLVAAAAALVVAAAGAYAVLGGAGRVPPAPPAAEGVALRVDTDPPGAFVRVTPSGRTWTTPAEMKLSELGSERPVLVFSKAGFRSVTHSPLLVRGETLRMVERLEAVGADPAPPPPPLPPAPPRIVIEVRTTPPGATLKVTGQSGEWTTPASLTDRDLPGAEAELEISLSGYKPFREKVALPAATPRSWTLEKLAREVAFTVVSEPSGARVVLNDLDTGEKTPCTIFRDDLRSPIARIELRLEGYQAATRPVELRAEAHEVKVTLSPLTGTFSVGGALPKSQLRLVAVPPGVRNPRAVASLWSENADSLAQALALLDPADAGVAVERLKELARRPEPGVRERAAKLAASPPAAAAATLDASTSADGLGNAVLENARVSRRYHLVASAAGARDFVSDELQPLHRKETVVRVEMTALAVVSIAVRPAVGSYQVVGGDGVSAGALSPGQSLRVPAGPVVVKFAAPSGDPLLCAFTASRRTSDRWELSGNLYALCGAAFEESRDFEKAARAYAKALEEKTFPAGEEAERSKLPGRIASLYRSALDAVEKKPLGADSARRLDEARALPPEAAAPALIGVALAPDAPKAVRGGAAGALAAALSRLKRPYESMEWLERAAAEGADPGAEIEGQVLSAARGFPGLDERGSEVSKALEAARKAASAATASSRPGGRLGILQLASATYGVHVRLDEGASAMPGDVFEVIRDGAAIGELTALKTLNPDRANYPHGGLECKVSKGTLKDLKKGDEVRKAGR